MITTDARVDAGFIAAHLDDPSVRLVEVDVSPAAYEAGHIPGAVLWNAYTDLRHPDYTTLSGEELQALLGRSGITPDTTVVTYGYGAHLGYWLLRSIGHDRVTLMDGPREQWADGGHAWSTHAPAHEGTRYDRVSQDHFIASRSDVSVMIDQPSRVVLDVRSEAEYLGANFWPSGAPYELGLAGHVPGSLHLPIDSLSSSDGTFKSTAEMRQIVGDLDLTPSSEIATFCTIGNRASQAWYALSVLLGYENVRVYYGAWVEWGMDPDTPIES